MRRQPDCITVSRDLHKIYIQFIEQLSNAFIASVYTCRSL